MKMRLLIFSLFPALLFGYESLQGPTELLYWDKDDFLGRAALAGLRDRGLVRKRAGIVLTGRGIARRGAAVHHGDREVAAYLPPDLAAPGAEVEAEVRGRRIPGHTVRLPFYKRPRARPRGGSAG